MNTDGVRGYETHKREQFVFWTISRRSPFINLRLYYGRREGQTNSTYSFIPVTWLYTVKDIVIDNFLRYQRRKGIALMLMVSN